jgi:uncharacterized protein YfeS
MHNWIHIKLKTLVMADTTEERGMHGERAIRQSSQVVKATICKTVKILGFDSDHQLHKNL